MNTEAAKARADIQKTFGFTPTFLAAVPDVAIAGAWQELRDLQISQTTALPCETKELIGLAVASQVPCKYCTYTHTQFAQLNGASKEEVGEAVVMSGLTRHWSTFMNGVQLDEGKFRKDIADLVARMKKMASAKHPPAHTPIDVVDAKSALADIEQTFGMVPEFLKRFPAVALPGAWKEMRDVEMSETTAISGKNKSLIGLAVASQIPCKFCVIADTEFAKLQGATEAEITEAIAMAGLTRHWSTLLNGLQIDFMTHKKEVDRIVNDAKMKMKQVASGLISTRFASESLAARF